MVAGLVVAQLRRLGEALEHLELRALELGGPLADVLLEALALLERLELGAGVGEQQRAVGLAVAPHAEGLCAHPAAAAERHEPVGRAVRATAWRREPASSR